MCPGQKSRLTTVWHALTSHRPTRIQVRETWAHLLAVAEAPDVILGLAAAEVLLAYSGPGEAAEHSCLDLVPEATDDLMLAVSNLFSWKCE